MSKDEKESTLMIVVVCGGGTRRGVVSALVLLNLLPLVLYVPYSLKTFSS
jgi:hypothetical protein